MGSGTPQPAALPYFEETSGGGEQPAAAATRAEQRDEFIALDDGEFGRY
jgi:hypothetical protein